MLLALLLVAAVPAVLKAEGSSSSNSSSRSACWESGSSRHALHMTARKVQVVLQGSSGRPAKAGHQGACHTTRLQLAELASLIERAQCIHPQNVLERHLPINIKPTQFASKTAGPILSHSSSCITVC
jgi:hypothetical protein